MGLLDRFRRNKEAVVEQVAKPGEKKPDEKEPSLLKQVCDELYSDDTALHGNLYCSLLSDPRREKSTYEETMKKAKTAEEAKNTPIAKAGYQIAGALAMYEKNVAGVKMAFDKVAELAESLGGMKYERIREVPERAVEVAQEVYKRKGIIKEIETNEKK